MTHVVMLSSGAGSAVAARRVVDRHGPGATVLLFADVNGEHPDNYRFLDEVVAWLGARFVRLDNGGETIWSTFHRERFLGNTRIDTCSKKLKRQPMRRWLDSNCDPADTVVHLGFDWTEAHRLERSWRYWDPWPVEAPLCWDPPLDKGDALAVLSEAGIAPPWLTLHGFPHANCGGGCVKAGAKQFRHLLRKAPDTFATWEKEEQALRDELGDVAILRNRRGGVTRPFTLAQLREVAEVQPALLDEDDWGGCNCMVPGEDE